MLEPAASLSGADVISGAGGFSGAGDVSGVECALPELASVYWRPLADERSLRRAGRTWAAITAAHTLPFVAVAALLVVLRPITAPVALILLVHAWIIPELYAARGANVLRPRNAPRGRTARAGAADTAQAERVARGLLGDLLDHRARELHEQTGLIAEAGKLGEWVIGEAGAVLVTRRGRRVHCYCVKATDPQLPAGDRIAHLLLALREHEAGFATVANLAFCGARWRLARRLAPPAREALAIAAVTARER